MIYSISDLHLDYTKKKSMDIFGPVWENYEEKIFENWKNKISEDDLVLICGDISWQMRLEEALKDLKRIDDLPGEKIFTKGNHDYWWQSISKIRNSALSNSKFIQNDSVIWRNWSICGIRGWPDPTSSEFSEHDQKIFDRELHRLELSLESAKTEEIILMIHYPPFTVDKNPNAFVDLMKKYPVKYCVYGHLHSDGLYQVVEGKIEGIEFICSSSDYIHFNPVKITK